MAKSWWVASSRSLIVLALCFAPTIAAWAQSTLPGRPRIAKAVPPTSEEVVGFVIKAGEKTAEFKVFAPVKGLFYFDMDHKTRVAVKAKFFGRNGKLLGTGGVRLTRPGMVLVRFTRNAPSNTDMEKAVPVEGRFVLVENDPDRFEPNDTPGEARILKLGPDNPIAGGPAMLFPDGDVDWFRLQITSPGRITPYILRPGSHSSGISLYDAKGRRVRFGRAIRVEPGMYAFRNSGTAVGFELTEVGFTYLPIWDDCDSKVLRQNACMLEIGKSTNITLPRYSRLTGSENISRKLYAVTAQKMGFVILSLSGLPKAKYNNRNVLTAGLKLEASVAFAEGGRLKYVTSHVSYSSLIFRAEKPGLYKIELRWEWLRTDSLRVIKLTPLFRRHIAISIQDSDLIILGMAPNDRGGRIALGLSLLAGAGGGYYSPAFTSKKITSVLKKFIDGVDPKSIKIKPKPGLTAEQLELARLMGLRAYLAAEKGKFLYRHHFRTKSGEVLKRLEKTKTPGQPRAKLVYVKTEKLSPVISRRMLDRDIQNLE